MSNPKMPEGNLIKVRFNYWAQGNESRHTLQFVYDNGAIIEMPFKDQWTTQEWDVPFAEQPDNESQ